MVFLVFILVLRYLEDMERLKECVLMRQYEYTVLYEPAEEGGYVVTCPALPGLVTEGDTLAAARAMAKDAIAGYLRSLRKDGLPIPPDKTLRQNPVKERVCIALKT